MQPIILTAVVDEKRRIMIDLPDDVPMGEVQFKINFFPLTDEVHESPSHEWLKAKLREAGMLVEADLDFADAEELSEEEEIRLSYVFASDRTALDLVNEDREERF